MSGVRLESGLAIFEDCRRDDGCRHQESEEETHREVADAERGVAERKKDLDGEGKFVFTWRGGVKQTGGPISGLF